MTYSKSILKHIPQLSNCSHLLDPLYQVVSRNNYNGMFALVSEQREMRKKLKSSFLLNSRKKVLMIVLSSYCQSITSLRPLHIVYLT